MLAVEYIGLLMISRIQQYSSVGKKSVYVCTENHLECYAPRYLHCLSLTNRITDVNVHLCVCIVLLFC